MENSDDSIYNEIVKTNATSTPVNEKVMCREETDGDLNAHNGIAAWAVRQQDDFFVN